MEALICMLILSIGMLGVAAAQLTSLRNSRSAMQRSQAVIETYAILDAMRSNAPAARANGYNIAIDDGCAVPGSASSLAQKDLAAWIASLHATVGPGACGGISCAGSVCEIAIRWNDELGSGGSTEQMIATQSRI